MSKMFRYGGYVASTVLVLAGLGTAIVGALGFAEVRDTIRQEEITATPDAQELGTGLEPGQEIRTASEAKEFATIIRSHALQATDGRTFAQMGRFLAPDGEETNDPAEAATDDAGRPMENPRRNIWITATSLTTALNTAFLAERIALFSILMGIALILTGVGFLVLTVGAIRSA